MLLVKRRMPNHAIRIETVIICGETAIARVHAGQVFLFVAFTANFMLGRFFVRNVLLLFPFGATILKPNFNLLYFKTFNPMSNPKK